MAPKTKTRTVVGIYTDVTQRPTYNAHRNFTILWVVVSGLPNFNTPLALHDTVDRRLGTVFQPIACLALTTLRCTINKRRHIHQIQTYNKLTTKLNKILNPGLVASYDIQPGNGSSLF